MITQKITKDVLAVVDARVVAEAANATVRKTVKVVTNNLKFNQKLNEMREYAKLNHVPIINDEGLSFLKTIIALYKPKNILEIGTAIGYSAIMMATVNKDITITSIERDEKRYLEAIKNIKKAKLEDRIHLIYKDALEVEVSEFYDMIFIDAAKAQNIKFFERFTPHLVPNGTVITDNMSFHGLVDKKEEQIKSRNVRQLVKKVKNYKDYLQKNNSFFTQFLEIGDGLAISIKK